jgi:endonuclease/exonuclease/phosphatase family metal-dependent hydrolase
VVRRVRLGRRHVDGRRTSGWAGPPPLLLVATVVALLVTPFIDQEAAPPAQVTNAAATSGPVLGPRAIPRDALPARLAGGTASRGIKPVSLRPVRAGVATFNMFRKLSLGHARQDALALTRRPSIDVVGWQEAQTFGPALRGLPGWRTQTFGFGEGRSELAVSWRSDEYRLVRARQRVVATGVGWEVGRYPFGTRLVAVVTLQHRETGRTLTVINTHLPQAVEDLDWPGHFRNTINAYRAKSQLHKLARVFRTAPGRWVVGTGDYNFDARADARNRPAGGPRDALDGTAVSSYQALGTDVTPTFPVHGRWIDYVWAEKKEYAQGRIGFAGQWVLTGLNSDHHALVTQLVLS